MNDIAGLFERAGVKITISEDIKRDAWIKLMWNAAFNPLTALTGLYVREFLEIEGSEKIVAQVMKEVVEVARNEGIDLKEEIVFKLIENTKRFGEVKTSMLQDFERGKRLELEGINGVVVKLGEKHGIPTPLNRIIYHLLRIKSKV